MTRFGSTTYILFLLLQSCASGGLRTHDGGSLATRLLGCYDLRIGPWSRAGITDGFPERIVLLSERVEPLPMSPFVFKVPPPREPSSHDDYEYRFRRQDGRPDHLGLEDGGRWWVTPVQDSLVLLYGHPHWGTVTALRIRADSLRGQAVMYDHSSPELHTAEVLAWHTPCRYLEPRPAGLPN